jgi:uncharacterized protein YecE (DUF72 family)
MELRRLEGQFLQRRAAQAVARNITPNASMRWKLTGPSTIYCARTSPSRGTSGLRPNFHFAVKGHRYITHIKRLEPPTESFKLQRDSTAPLGEKLAAMLWQLPPNLHKDMRKLAAFIAMLAMWPEVRHVIEFRDQSWFDDEVAALMTRERIALCQSDAATWPMWRAITTDLVFIRLHGHAATYASNYDRDSLELWAKGIRQWLDDGRDVHIYFDNDAKGYSPWNALTLADILGVTRKGRDRSEFAARRPTRKKVASVLRFMDHWWTDHHRGMEPKLDEPPSFYFKRQFWGTFEDDRAGLLTRELIGVDRLMWGSDYPHTEGTFPHSREQIAKGFVGIPEKEIRTMVAENAVQLYGVN